MKVRFWGTRGSLATPGRETARYGGNTSCVEIQGSDGGVLVLDAGTGIRALGEHLPPDLARVDVLISHLHMDHIQGLGFFAPLFEPGREVHLWGPASSTQALRTRLMRYLSAPLFPVPLRDLACRLELHEMADSTAQIGEFSVQSCLVCHPGPTLGFRIATSEGRIAYLSDHEPALGDRDLSLPGAWISGYALARDVDLLIHDAQYSDSEYASRVGWGHSTLRHATAFAAKAGARCLVAFHHDPTHDDATVDRMLAEAAQADGGNTVPIVGACEGDVLEVENLLAPSVFGASNGVRRQENDGPA
jgi:phosphoribosyl 1,2-cyclic phosphodiesterase